VENLSAAMTLVSLDSPLRVKTGKAQCEHMFSALPPKADVAQRGRHVRFVRFAIFCAAEYSIIQSSGWRWHRGPYPRPIAEVSSGSAINITSEVIDDWAAMERLHTDEGLRRSEVLFRKLFTVRREA
jgi:hypothetical protein